MTTFVAERSESDAKEFERKFFCEKCDSRVDLFSGSYYSRDSFWKTFGNSDLYTQLNTEIIFTANID